MSAFDVALFLQHAAWHCMFGSEPDNADRDATRADTEAYDLLMRLQRQILFERNVEAFRRGHSINA